MPLTRTAIWFCFQTKMSLFAFIAFDTLYARLTKTLAIVRITNIRLYWTPFITWTWRTFKLQLCIAFGTFITLLARITWLTQTLAIRAITYWAIRAIDKTIARLTTHRRITPVAHFATFAVPAFSIASGKNKHSSCQTEVQEINLKYSTYSHTIHCPVKTSQGPPSQSHNLHEEPNSVGLP